MIENRPTFSASTLATVLICVSFMIYPNLVKFGLAPWGLFAIIIILASFVAYENWDYLSGRWEKRQELWVCEKLRERQ